MMSTTIAKVLASWGLLALAGAGLAAETQPNVAQTQAPDARATGLPSMELEPRLAAIFAVTRCEFMSGMTCRITYNGKSPLPSEVYFTEYDESGKALGQRTRLIYPKLEKGESGRATFRLRASNPTRVVLSGTWNGPWRNPY
jgi:hypothetical protein